jgi:hypothetical protein
VNSGGSYLVEAGVVEIHPDIAVTDINGQLKRTTLTEIKKLVRNGIPIQIVRQESKTAEKKQKDTPISYSKDDEGILNAIEELEELEELEEVEEVDDAPVEVKVPQPLNDDDDDIFTATDSFGFDVDEEDYDDEDEV